MSKHCEDGMSETKPDSDPPNTASHFQVQCQIDDGIVFPWSFLSVFQERPLEDEPLKETEGKTKDNGRCLAL